MKNFRQKFFSIKNKIRNFVPFFRRYALLACGILAANYVLLRALSIVMPLAVAKLLTEVTLFAISFAAQRALVFTHKELSTRKGQLITR